MTRCENEIISGRIAFLTRPFPIFNACLLRRAGVADAVWHANEAAVAPGMVPGGPFGWAPRLRPRTHPHSRPRHVRQTDAGPRALWTPAIHTHRRKALEFIHGSGSLIVFLVIGAVGYWAISWRKLPPFSNNRQITR
jgi:hypothetical protein